MMLSCQGTPCWSESPLRVSGRTFPAARGRWPMHDDKLTTVAPSAAREASPRLGYKDEHCHA